MMILTSYFLMVMTWRPVMSHEAKMRYTQMMAGRGLHSLLCADCWCCCCRGPSGAA